MQSFPLQGQFGTDVFLLTLVQNLNPTLAPFFLTQIAGINNLCKSHQVKTLFAFGSVLRADFRPDSDVDLLVDIDAEDPYIYTDFYFSLKEQLEQLLGRPVDLLEQRALKNPYFISEIERNKQLIYGR